MIFNSYEFLFGFLPLLWIVYYLLNRLGLFKISISWFIFGSLFFYAFWNVYYLPLFLASMLMNYLIGTTIGRNPSGPRAKVLLVSGVTLNLAALGYYKYADFFISNVNGMFNSNLSLLNLTLPLAISFFTFQQIGYIVDAYRGEKVNYTFTNYVLFVSFFPHLIAGPIVQHKEILPQFADKRNFRVIPENIAKGLFIFAVGLFKKVVIADTFAVWATAGFAAPSELSFLEAWITSLAYTFQLYFDFSGYTDMAIGAGFLFNIRLPINFNSPYKAVNIQDFWKRWHITLTKFLTHYLYVPLGGNRKGPIRTYINVFLVFFLSGIWHGAGWTFIIWGTMHGLASMLNRFWQKRGFKMNRVLGWFITFQFVNAAWVFFRAETWNDAIAVLRGMVGLNGFLLPESMSVLGQGFIPFEFVTELPLIAATESSLLTIILSFIAVFVVVLFGKNALKLTETFKPTWTWAVYIAILYLTALFNMTKVSEFLYFNF